MGGMFRVVDLGYGIPYELEQEEARVRSGDSFNKY